MTEWLYSHTVITTSWIKITCQVRQHIKYLNISMGRSCHKNRFFILIHHSKKIIRIKFGMHRKTFRFHFHHGPWFMELPWSVYKLQWVLPISYGPKIMIHDQGWTITKEVSSDLFFALLMRGPFFQQGKSQFRLNISVQYARPNDMTILMWH